MKNLCYNFLKNITAFSAITLVLIASSAVSDEDLKNTKITYGDQLIIELLKRN